MTKEITRAQFDALDPMAKAEAARTMKIVDPVQPVVPDHVRLVHTEGGVRTVYSRQAFNVLPETEKARIGRTLRVETIQVAE